MADAARRSGVINGTVEAQPFRKKIKQMRSGIVMARL
jgi:hypothetical protein